MKVPSTSNKQDSSDKRDVLLSPEMFFHGANKTSYDDLSLDIFMQGYTALLNDERYLYDCRTNTKIIYFLCQLTILSGLPLLTFLIDAHGSLLGMAS